MVKPSLLLGSRVLVLPDKAAERSQGGIIIPVVVNQSLEQGVVEMIGDLVINVEPLDRILYPAGAGIPYDIGGVEYRFIEGPTKDSPGNIIAII